METTATSGSTLLIPKEHSEMTSWFLHLTLAPSLCFANEFPVERKECSACLACRQMKGVAEIHAVSVPLKGYLHSVRVGTKIT